MCALILALPVGIVIIALGIDLIRTGFGLGGFIVLGGGILITGGLCKLIKGSWDDAGPPIFVNLVEHFAVR